VHPVGDSLGESSIVTVLGQVSHPLAEHGPIVGWRHAQDRGLNHQRNPQAGFR
jgi:hypothetical protein